MFSLKLQMIKFCLMGLGIISAIIEFDLALGSIYGYGL